MNEKLEMLLGAKFTLLGSKLTAAFEKGENGYTILVAPTENEKNEGLTVKEMIEQVNQLIGKVDSTAPTIKSEDVEKQIQSTGNQQTGSKLDIQNLKIILDMAYLYIKIDGENKTIEYAFSLIIDASEVIPQDITFINIESVTIAIWNTKRNIVLDKMALFSPEKYIAG